TLYEETPESRAAREQRALERRLARPLGADLGARPTKQARRRLDAFRRRRGSTVQARASLTPTEWLLKSDEPAIAFLTRRDVLGEHVEPDPEAILAGPIVRGLLDGQQPDGGFGSHPYKKWTGAHWRLVSLVELGVPAGHPPALAAAETVLDWLTGKGHRQAIKA